MEFQSKRRDKCCCSEHPLASWSKLSLISKVVPSKSTCYWLQYRENWLAHMQDCNFGKSVSFNILIFCSDEEKGLWGRKGAWGSETRQNASICFQSALVPTEAFCQIREMNYCTVSGVWCNSFRSLWVGSQLLSFCRLGELWFTVWGIPTQQLHHKFCHFQSTTLGICSFRMPFGRWQ